MHCDPPTAMINPHAHHILFKKGLGQKQQELVREGQEILRRYGIDPIIGEKPCLGTKCRSRTT